MKKYIFTYLLILSTYWGFSQNVEGSWIVIAENNDMSELSINETDQVIGLERYDKEQRPTGQRNDLEMVEVIQRKGYKLYIGKLPEQERYIALCFFEVGEKESIKLFIKERLSSVQEAKDFEKNSNLGVHLYKKEKIEKIQMLKSVENISKIEFKKAMEKVLVFLKGEVSKEENLGYDAEVYVISELHHNLILQGYNPYTEDLDDLLGSFEADEDIKKIYEGIEALLDVGSEKMVEEARPSIEEPISPEEPEKKD